MSNINIQLNPSQDTSSPSKFTLCDENTPNLLPHRLHISVEPGLFVDEEILDTKLPFEDIGLFVVDEELRGSANFGVGCEKKQIAQFE